jgi:broad specificity phosphatase PhoE
MKLILTRHGQTEANVAGLAQGQTPGILTPEGIAQAKRLASRLKDENLDVIFASDLARARDTVLQIACHHPSTPVFFVPELRERSFGSFEGMPNSAIDWHNPPEQFESLSSMQERAQKILDLVRERYKGKTVLFVSHGGLYIVLASLILAEHGELQLHVEHPHNTAVSIFEIKEDKKHVVQRYNCVEHLTS